MRPTCIHCIFMSHGDCSVGMDADPARPVCDRAILTEAAQGMTFYDEEEDGIVLDDGKEKQP